jgi:hypothetical protein
VQIDPSVYRNPDALPAGAVLVIGRERSKPWYARRVRKVNRNWRERFRRPAVQAAAGNDLG